MISTICYHGFVQQYIIQLLIFNDKASEHHISYLWVDILAKLVKDYLSVYFYNLCWMCHSIICALVIGFGSFLDLSENVFLKQYTRVVLPPQVKFFCKVFFLAKYRHKIAVISACMIHSFICFAICVKLCIMV